MLAATEPVYSTAWPPAPVVIVAEPDKMMLSVVLPTASPTPESSTTAAVEVAVVATLCETVRSPVVVFTATVLEAEMPWVDPTVPTVSAPVLVKLTLPTPLAATVLTVAASV